MVSTPNQQKPIRCITVLGQNERGRYTVLFRENRSGRPEHHYNLIALSMHKVKAKGGNVGTVLQVGGKAIMKGAKTMNVGEVVKMTTCSQIRIRGSYSGKIYYQSWTNSKERLKQFENERCYGIKAELHVPIREYDPDCVYPVICIWMDDYDKCSKGARV